MSRPSTHKPTAGRAAEGIDRTMQGVYRRLPENIRLLMAKYDVDPAEVAAALNIAKRTFCEKKRTPWDLSLGQIEIIAKVLHTDPATLMYGEIVPVDMSGTISARGGGEMKKERTISPESPCYRCPHVGVKRTGDESTITKCEFFAAKNAIAESGERRRRP